MIRRLIILLLIVGCVFANILPNSYFLSSLNRSSIILPSNSVVDIREGINGKLYFGTSGGLGYAEFDNSNPIFHTIISDSLPKGGNSATCIYNNIIAISGVIDTAVATGNESAGTGISYADINDNIWKYLPQPIDSIPVAGQYHTIEWGGQNLTALAVTTEINNISYDVAVDDNYIYVTSWAGGLRRYNYTDENSDWKIIPLPMDGQGWLECGQIDIGNYQLNPRDPADGGNHNHKGFAVYTIEDTVWVGTAGGINKGIINGDCINWITHFTSWWHNISGNWVIGFHHQEFEDYMRLWAITWSAGNNEANALSYTEDGGATWEITNPLGEETGKVYNVFSKDIFTFASTEIGLYFTSDNTNWQKITSPFEDTEVEGSDAVLTSIIPNVDEYALWIGTNNGVARSYNWGIDWEKFSYDLSVDDFHPPFNYNLINIYPNPFNPTTTISFSILKFGLTTITVYDITGRNLETLTNEVLSIGNHSINWNASSYPSGVYLIRMISADFTQTQKVVLVK